MAKLQSNSREICPFHFRDDSTRTHQANDSQTGRLADLLLAKRPWIIIY